MKTVKRIVLTLLTLFVLSALFGYFYFDQKFTPEKNYLIVKKQSGKIPIVWEGSAKNALLVPIHFETDTTTYFLQFDTGSPYTVFYTNAVEKIKQINYSNKTAEAAFFIGQTKVSSNIFKIVDNGGNFKAKDPIKIIGTLGSDILENRKTLLHFKKNFIEFNLDKQPIGIQNKLFTFQFKKRKIIIPGILKDKKEKFLYDSGTSAYELLTSNEVWNDLKTKQSKVTIEKSKSWQNTLTAYTAKSNNTVIFNTKRLPIQSVTYVDGFSKTQYLLMKFSGMTGMLGNKFFLGNTIYLDCSSENMAIE
jgi:hypothetical protein